MGNDDTLGVDVVTAHPHEGNWTITSLNISGPKIDHLLHSECTLFNSYSPIRKLSIDA